jgi:hypothetical protein
MITYFSRGPNFPSKQSREEPEFTQNSPISQISQTKCEQVDGLALLK